MAPSAASNEVFACPTSDVGPSLQSLLRLPHELFNKAEDTWRDMERREDNPPPHRRKVSSEVASDIDCLMSMVKLFHSSAEQLPLVLRDFQQLLDQARLDQADQDFVFDILYHLSYGVSRVMVLCICHLVAGNGSKPTFGTCYTGADPTLVLFQLNIYLWKGDESLAECIQEVALTLYPDHKDRFAWLGVLRRVEKLSNAPARCLNSPRPSWTHGDEGSGPDPSRTQVVHLQLLPGSLFLPDTEYVSRDRKAPLYELPEMGSPLQTPPLTNRSQDVEFSLEIGSNLMLG